MFHLIGPAHDFNMTMQLTYICIRKCYTHNSTKITKRNVGDYEKKNYLEI